MPLIGLLHLMIAVSCKLYETAAQGVFAEDAALLFALARAQPRSGDPKAAEATLNRLREAHPSIQHQEAHPLYARALEAQGRLAKAKQDCEALCGYYAGFEASPRYGLLLQRNGEPSRARALFEAVVKAGNSRRIAVLESDREWLKVAKAISSRRKNNTTDIGRRLSRNLRKRMELSRHLIVFTELSMRKLAQFLTGSCHVSVGQTLQGAGQARPAPDNGL